MEFWNVVEREKIVWKLPRGTNSLELIEENECLVKLWNKDWIDEGKALQYAILELSN